MPIKGFTSASEHTKEKIIDLYGRKGKRTYSKFKTLHRSQRIPYILGNGDEILIGWGRLLLRPLNEEFIPKKIITNLNHSRIIIIPKRKRLTKKERNDVLPGYKKCGYCKTSFKIEEFNRGKLTYSYCRICSSKVRLINTQKIKKTSEGRRWYAAMKMFHGAKKRAKQKRMDFSITADFVYQNIPEFCPILGIKITLCGPNQDGNSPSLDRVDNSKGYTLNNTRIISHRANSLKNGSSLEDLRKITTYISDHYGKQNSDYQI